jgi:hypothetical protein
LLGTLVYFVPSFCFSLLTAGEDASSEDPLVITVLCDIIRSQLAPPRNNKTTKMTLKQKQIELDPDHVALGEVTLCLFEALCWAVPDGLELRYFHLVFLCWSGVIGLHRLVSLVRGEGVLDALLDNRQPSWLLYRTVRGLVLFAASKWSPYLPVSNYSTFVVACRIGLVPAYSVLPVVRG